MKKLILIFLIGIIILELSCKNVSNSNSNNSDTVNVFSKPETVIDSFFYGIQHNKPELIEKCYTGNFERTAFKRFKVSNYYIISKELIKENETQYRQKSDICFKLAVIRISNDTVIFSFNLRKSNIGWIIVGYSSILEDQMEEDIQKTINDLPTNIDSVESYKNHKLK